MTILACLIFISAQWWLANQKNKDLVSLNEQNIKLNDEINALKLRMRYDKVVWQNQIKKLNEYLIDEKKI